jgi:ABC-type Fe3+/spermidine/putrescine transport system ATPase subunit
MVSESLLTLHELTISKERSILLDNVTVEFRSASVTAVLGATGCGKSTLIRAVAGLEPVKSGRITLNGIDLTSASPYKRDGIATVLQRPGIFPNTSTYKNIEIVLKSRRSPPSDMNAEIKRILGVVELNDMASLKVDRFSGGETARVAIARGLAVDPTFLIVDEALTAIDAPLRRRILGRLKEWSVLQNRGLIFVTHDQLDAFMFADHLVLIDKGKHVASGPPKEVYSFPPSRSVGEFLGLATTFTGTITDTNDTEGIAIANIEDLGVSASIRIPASTEAAKIQQVTIIIRPEDVIVSPVGVDVVDHEIEGYVLESIFTGGSAYLRLEIGQSGKNLIARDPSDYPFDRFKYGERVTFMLRKGIAAVCP